jgi:hypothetical protein
MQAYGARRYDRCLNSKTFCKRKRLAILRSRAFLQVHPGSLLQPYTSHSKGRPGKPVQRPAALAAKVSRIKAGLGR